MIRTPFFVFAIPSSHKKDSAVGVHPDYRSLYFYGIVDRSAGERSKWWMELALLELFETKPDTKEASRFGFVPGDVNDFCERCQLNVCAGQIEGDRQATPDWIGFERKKKHALFADIGSPVAFNFSPALDKDGKRKLEPRRSSFLLHGSTYLTFTYLGLQIKQHRARESNWRFGGTPESQRRFGAFTSESQRRFGGTPSRLAALVDLPRRGEVCVPVDLS